MTLQINMRPNASVMGPSGLMTAAGNPWTVADAFAQELVNRGVATAVSWPVPGPTLSSVVSIAGSNAVGSVLTAALASGWTATGYQWTRGGVAISGATSSTYTLQNSDALQIIACVVAGLTNISTGITIGSATAFLEASAVFDGSYLTTTMPGGLDSSTGSMSFWLKPNFIFGSYRDLFVAGRTVIGIDNNGSLYGWIQDASTSLSFTFRTVSPVTPGHYAIEWDTAHAAGAKVAHVYVNGVSVPLTLYDTSASFVAQYQFFGFVACSYSGANPSSVDLGEFMFWPGVFANWASNIGQVYSGGLPVDPGASGAVLSGVIPVVYLSVRGSALASTFLTNRGSGPAYTLVGNSLQRADEALIGYGNSLMYGQIGEATLPWMGLVAHGLNRPIKQANFGIGGLTISAIAGNMESGNVTYSIPSAAVVAASYKARIWALEGGYNSIPNGAASILSDATRMVNALLAADPSAKWIFLGIPNGNLSGDGISSGGRYTTIIAANNSLATLCGAHFLDIRQWLITNGLAAAGLTAGANDTADIADGIVPRQLRLSDTSVHWSDAGHRAVSIAVKAKLQALGYD